MTIRGLVGEAPTKNQEMLNWIEEAVELFQPESVVFCDGSEAVSYTHLTLPTSDLV